jgi:hypothetical protein
MRLYLGQGPGSNDLKWKVLKYVYGRRQRDSRRQRWRAVRNRRCENAVSPAKGSVKPESRWTLTILCDPDPKLYLIPEKTGEIEFAVFASGVEENVTDPERQWIRPQQHWQRLLKHTANQAD